MHKKQRTSILLMSRIGFKSETHSAGRCLIDMVPKHHTFITGEHTWYLIGLFTVTTDLTFTNSDLVGCVSIYIVSE